MSKFRKVVMLGVLGCVLASATQAQVVREDDASSIAGRLSSLTDQDEYTFNSNGGEILFADMRGGLRTAPQIFEGSRSL